MRHASRVVTGHVSAQCATRAIAAAAVICALAACKDSVVPDYQSPSINPTSQSAIQQQVTGIISATRQSTETGSDILYYIQAMSSFDRDACNFTNTDSRYLTEWCGDHVAIPNSDFYGTVVWDNEFRVAKNADLILTNLPSVTPAYTAAQANLIKGIVQTWKAYNFMLLAETRDTNGVPVAGVALPQGQLAPILCTRDVWKYITALLDSGEADLDAGAPAGGASGPLPVTLPPGFSNASLAGPSDSAGTFAGFNRALRAKAGLEYAYAVTRSPGGTPATPSTPGSPLATALLSADSAAHASFIFDGGAVPFVQTTATDFADPRAVYHSFSGASGDVPNPVQGNITTIYVLNAADSEMTADPADKRAGKLIANSSAPGQTGLDTTAATLAMTIGTYSSPSSPIPIIRNEELVLIDAAILLGEGNTSGAVGLINVVRHAAGAAPVSLTTYPTVRDQILHEFRMSNILETGEDRTIMIRDYGVEAQNTTTWFANDIHTTVEPIPVGEAAARNNNLSTSCP